MADRVIEETAEYRDVETVSDGWPDRQGSVRSVRREWKRPSPDQRREQLAAKIESGQASVALQRKVLAALVRHAVIDVETTT